MQHHDTALVAMAMKCKGIRTFSLQCSITASLQKKIPLQVPYLISVKDYNHGKFFSGLDWTTRLEHCINAMEIRNSRSFVYHPLHVSG